MPTYWCHKCRRRCTALERYDDGVRCGRCHEGFIEEIDDIQEDHSQRSASDSPQQTPPPLVLQGDENPFGAFPGSPFARLFQLIHNNIFPTTTAAAGNVGRQTVLVHRRSASEGPSTATHQPQHRHAAATPPPVPMDQQPHTQRSHAQQQASDRPQPQQHEQINHNDLLTLFMDQFLGPIMNNAQMDNTGGRTQVIIQLGGDGGGGGAQPGGIFNIHGNLQDYAWGEHGLDNVLTALLNTFDGTQQQTRALRPEDIDKLPSAKVGPKHIENATQCTTCMEYFVLDETVAKLDCEHIFHPDCLKPWLARNNTCPICRKQIDPSKWGPSISDVDELD
ncbi:hypothetical protein niasHS_012356 [Heterodera schachtii]|uniref:RING-type domain-containing protein n=1 Tax=Heterodera schachtii TaxID=97005 RepID=A0ABD2IQ56_HETSC